jgi:hypothetical protein
MINMFIICSYRMNKTIQYISNDQCVDVNKDNVSLSNCDGSNQQSWLYNQVTGQIINQNSGLCISEDRESMPVVLAKCSGSEKQVFNFHEDFGQIVNEKSNNCLVVDTTTLDNVEVPVILSDKCQFNTFQGPDNFTSKIFYEENVLAAGSTTSGITQRTKSQFTILLSLVLVFGALSISGFGILTAVAIKKSRQAKRNANTRTI